MTHDKRGILYTRERGLTCAGKKWAEAKYLDFKGKEK